LNALAIGLLGMVVPTSIHLMLPIRVMPLGARFVAALYLAAALGVIISAFVRHPGDTAIFVICFGIATGLLLLQTLLHWEEYTVDGIPYGWVGIYIFDPVMALLIIITLWSQFTLTFRRHPLTWLFIIEGVIFGSTGLLLLLAPDVAAAVWPWQISPLVGQLYSSFFLTFCVGALLTAGESRIVTIRNFTITSLGLMIFVLAGSLLHLSAFRPSIATWLWFGALIVGVCVFAWALMRLNAAGQLQQGLAGPN
jgi:hypothetical protein